MGLSVAIEHGPEWKLSLPETFFRTYHLDRHASYALPVSGETGTLSALERIGLFSAICCIGVVALWQASRGFRRSRKSSAEDQPDVNQVQQIARIRARARAIKKTSDFSGLLYVLTRDLVKMGLIFDRCEIDVIHEMVQPELDSVCSCGFRYTTYRLDTDGAVEAQSYHLVAPFPPVCLEPIERFVNGHAWRGRSGDTAIVEVPASNAARLRLVARSDTGFSDDEVGTLLQFAAAILPEDLRSFDVCRNQDTV